MNSFSHKPVLIDEIISFLKNNSFENSQDNFLDLTFGAGGYSKRLLEEFQNSQIFCFDQDPITKEYFEKMNLNFPNRAKFFLNNFSNAHDDLLNENIGHEFFDGIFFDLGVSSMQLDDKSRGFSFYGEDEKLDMRMNNSSDHLDSAFEFINYASEKEIADIIYYYGEERMARKIAKSIVNTREEIGEIKTTGELANLVAKIIPYKKNYNNKLFKTHPATKTFQAIRIHVNKELDHLVDGLQNIVQFLKPNGKLFVVTFHSLEDRIVKNFFTFMESGPKFENKKYFPKINCSEFFEKFKFKQSNIITPSQSEINQNIRSRSAKMRVLTRF